LPEGVFLAPVTSGPGEGRRVASLHEYLQGLLARRPSPGGAPVGGVLGEAWIQAQHLQVLRFCLNELTPHLRSHGGAPGGRGEGPLPLPQRTFERLDGWASELLGGLDLRLPPPGSLEALGSLLKVPSMVLAGTLIPLSPIAAARRRGRPIAIGGTPYVRRDEEGRPFNEVLRELRQEQEQCLQRRTMRYSRALTRMATQLLAEVKSVLRRCAPQDCGRYQLLYCDGEHQLQHSRGHWMLVRGPVKRRMDARTLFVGLHLAGRTRRDWLTLSPRAGAHPGDFWMPGGGPLRGGLCMGHPRQYTRLLTDHFTDAEAVVEWLDAGVILLTGRSELHRKLRAARENRLAARELAILRRAMR
jgi:hypothetical protein